MVRLIECESNVTTTNPRSKSLRTTIPIEIRNTLKLEPGSKLKWFVEIEGEELVVHVKRE